MVRVRLDGVRVPFAFVYSGPIIVFVVVSESVFSAFTKSTLLSTVDVTQPLEIQIIILKLISKATLFFN